MMRDSDKELLDGIERMGEQAKSIGICPLPFEVLYDRVSSLVAELDLLTEQIAAK